MLARFPRKVDIMDSDHRDIPRSSFQLRNIAYVSTEILDKKDTASEHGTRQDKCQRHPHIISCIRWYMLVQQPQEDGSGCEMLQDEELVAKTPQWDQRAYRHPGQY